MSLIILLLFNNKFSERERRHYFIPKRQKMPTPPKVSETDSAIPNISSHFCALCKQTMQKKKVFNFHRI